MENTKICINRSGLIKNALDDYLSCGVPDFRGIKKTFYLKKIINEKEIEKLLEKLIDEMEPYREINFDELTLRETDAIKEIMVSYLLKFDKNKYFFDKPFLNFFMDKGYLNIAEEFVARARKDDSNLKPYELFQAIRMYGL